MIHRLYGRRSWQPIYSTRRLLTAAINRRDRGHILEEDSPRLVRVNLQAAQVSSRSSAFESASEYLAICRRLQQQQNARADMSDPWDIDHYGLTLQIYTLAAEIESCRGCSANCRPLVNQVRENARSTRDML